MGSKRQDIQCQTCGRFRHRKCDQCGATNLIPDMQGRLVDHETRTLHVCGMPTVTSIPAQKETIVKDQAATFKPDKGMLDYVGTEKDKSYLIPPKSLLNSYIPRKVNGITDLEVLSRAYDACMAGNPQNVLLIGDAGTGKNHLSEALAALKEVPLVANSFNGGSTIEDIIGQPLFIGGETVWSDGWLPHLMRGPAIYVGDEINFCPLDISAVMLQVLDWRRQLVLAQKGREVIKAHPGFMFIGTMNPDYRGTRPLNEAFQDRFNLTLELDYDRKIEEKLGIPANWLNLADQLRKMYTETELETPCSTRMLLDYKRNVALYGEHVARDAFVNRYAKAERMAVRQAVSVHVDKEIGKLKD